MAEIFANSGDPDQEPRSALFANFLFRGLHCLPISLLGVCRLQRVNLGSDLGLHCSPISLLGVCRLQWVNLG